MQQLHQPLAGNPAQLTAKGKRPLRIGIYEKNLVPLLRQTDPKVQAEGRFADPALVAGNRDDLSHFLYR